MVMDIEKEEASLVYEERVSSSSPLDDEGSEDEDSRRELEEMLYSHVFYDSGSISAAKPIADNPSSMQSVVVQDINVQTPSKPGFPSEYLDGSPGLRLHTPCSRSQFNNPYRKKASRYYDVNQDKNNRESTFVAPQNPYYKPNGDGTSKNPEFSVPSPMTSRIFARSSDEKVYQPSKLTRKEETVTKKTVVNKLMNVSLLHSEGGGNPVLQDNGTNIQEISVTKHTDESAIKAKDSLVSKASDNVALGTGNKQTLTKTFQDDIDKAAKRSKAESSKKRNKQTNMQAKMSKVMSSMLDEESRSSADDNQSATNCTVQELKNLNSDSGWSIGMSWDDMSSKYNFEVDSLEDESVSSLQMVEGSTPADSGTQTSDILRHSTEQGDDDEQTPEPSRYSLNLKSNKNQTEHPCETDSESEVGSIVEVPPPVKPAPPLVDISDGEFAPMLESRKEKSSAKAGREISVLFAKRKNSSMGPVTNLIIDSSSDDDLIVLDVISTPVSGNKALLNVPKKRNLVKEQGKHATEDGIASKRLSQHQYNERVENLDKEGEILEKDSELLDDISASPDTKKKDKLELWLRNPIKSSKYLDHEKFLNKMSDDPSLWQICWADKTKMLSPRGLKCLNCNEFGHKVKMCPNPRKIVQCHMCGAPGHSESRCSQKMCLRCGWKNNIFTDRCRNCVSNKTPCKICNSLTHIWKFCPDLWRRYHLTTSSGEIAKPAGKDMRPRSEHWCSNCAARGHLSHECSKAQWKCESISPYIKSYATPTAEEEQFEGCSTAAMLLTDVDAAILNTAEGKSFLSTLVEKYQVTLRSSFDTSYKKLAIEGTSLIQEQVRNEIRNWVSNRKKSSKPQKDIHSSAQLALLSNVLPKKPDALASFLVNQLGLLEKPVYGNLNVQQLFNSVNKLSMKNLDFKHEKLKRNQCKLLNIILIGKCGFDGGHQHVQALKDLAERVRKGNSDVSKLRAQIAEHFIVVFFGTYREDYHDLVSQFYLDKNLVKQYDILRVHSSLQSSLEQESEVSESQSQNSKKKRNELLALSSDDEQISENTHRKSADKSEDLKPSCVDETCLPQVQNRGIAQLSASGDDLKSTSSSTVETRAPDIDDMPLSARLNKKENESKKKKNVIPIERRLSHLRRIVPMVLKNLASRFITSKRQRNLAQSYKLLFKRGKEMTDQEKRKLKEDVGKLTYSLCGQYKIPSQFLKE